VLRKIPQLEKCFGPEDLDVLKNALALDAVLNLSSVRGFQDGQTVVFPISDPVVVNRRELYTKLLSGDLIDQRITALHRGILAEIDVVISDAGFIDMMKNVYGVNDLHARMEYLRDNLSERKFGNSRAAKVIATLDAADAKSASSFRGG